MSEPAELTFPRFEPYMEGTYLLRWGPDGDCPQEERLNLKLCITATDQRALADELYELSLHPKCFAVKFSARDKEGMYIGRVFINDEDVMGRLWQKYKRHPKFYCSLQDDNFTARFRRIQLSETPR